MAKRPLNKWLQFANIPFQMGLIIFVGVFIGNNLDVYFKKEYMFIIIFFLISVFVVFYVVIKSVTNMGKND